jgi:hypothetical protein
VCATFIRISLKIIKPFFLKSALAKELVLKFVLEAKIRLKGSEGRFLPGGLAAKFKHALNHFEIKQAIY